MTNRRGAYLEFEHDRAIDWDWLAAWQPSVVRLMLQGDTPEGVSVDRVARVHRLVPGALINVRCWRIDDDDLNAERRMVVNPKAEAERECDWWARLFDRIHDVPRNQLLAGALNEPNTQLNGPQIRDFTARFLELNAQRSIRSVGYLFSVGNPAKAGEAPFDWPFFAQLDQLFISTNSFVGLNEYMQPEGMYAVWTDKEGNRREDTGNLIGRHRFTGMKARKIITEWGIDGILFDRHRHPEYGHNGWRNFPEWTPERYADEYVECCRTADPTVEAICPFLGDSADRKWFSFDPFPAFAALLARKHLCEPATATSTPTPPPVAPVVVQEPVGVALYIGIVTAGAGLNVRQTPSTDAPILARLAKATMVAVYEEAGDWLRVTNGWVSRGWVARVDAQPTPTAPPDQDYFPRAIEWVLKWEGGLSMNPEDYGNWTGGKKGVGELKGTNFGISAASYPTLDIKNLTKEQAIDIYERDYWQASGADKLPWPAALLVLDTAVLHGVGAAKSWLNEDGPNPYFFAARRLRVYTKSDNWNVFGNAWTARVADLLEEMA